MHYAISRSQLLPIIHLSDSLIYIDSYPESFTSKHIMMMQHVWIKVIRLGQKVSYFDDFELPITDLDDFESYLLSA